MGDKDKEPGQVDKFKDNIECDTNQELSDQVNSTSETTESLSPVTSSGATSLPIAISGASRRRTDSENEVSTSSAEEGKSGQGETGKRQRTLSASMFPLVAASPPGFVSLEEIMKAANSVSKMSLAHEIAVDSNFQLQKIEAPENSLQKMIKETMHRAFFDVLREELNSDPPEYERALQLLAEIKQGILSLLLPHQIKTQQEINEKLDTELIRQQAEAGTLDFKPYTQYILSVLARLCAPSRDEKIQQLTALDDIVLIYKGIIETLELMRLDMANFTIHQIRPQIVACSVEYERQKFEDYLKVTPDGLRNTREWLHRHRLENSKDSAAPLDPVKATVTILVDAFMELLQWDSSLPWPETLAMDETRFHELQSRLRGLEYLGAILLVALSQGSGSCASFLQSPEFRAALKEHVCILLESVHTDDELEQALPAVAIQVIKDFNSELDKRNLQKLSQEAERTLQGSIQDLASSSSRVRSIVRNRMLEFLRQVISSEVARPTQIPPGLSVLRDELAGLAGQFARLVSHNRAVFSAHYADLIKQHCLP